MLYNRILPPIWKVWHSAYTQSHNKRDNLVLDVNMQGNLKRGKKRKKDGRRPTENQTSGIDDKSRKKIRCRQLCLSRKKK